MLDEANLWLEAPMATTSLSSLPLELLEEIFRKVPIESLVRFRTTSKRWYAFLNDKRFIYKLLDPSQERFMQIEADHKSVQIFNPENTDAPPLLRLPTPDEFHNYNFGDPIHCDGLLLCNCAERGGYIGDARRKLAVWNPILSRFTWIEPSSSSYKRCDVFGFGYDIVSRDNYKILRINRGKFSKFEIYEFKSKLWRSLDAAAATALECGAPWWGSVSMNGNMYWIAQKKMTTVHSEIEFSIQCFDFSAETFKPVSCEGIDYSYRYGQSQKVLLSGFGGDRLSLLYLLKNVKMEVWVTSKLTDGVVVSWSKYFSVAPDPSTCGSLKKFIHKTNKMMFLCEEEDFQEKNVYTNVYEICEIRKQAVLRRRYRSCDGSPCINLYVPSLVPVPYLGELGSGSKSKSMFTFWCQVCSVGAFCGRAMRSHESGKRHKAAIERQNDQTSASTSIITVPQSEAIEAEGEK